VHVTGRSHSGMPDDIASLTLRTGFWRWPWPFPWLPFRDREPVIVELVTGDAAADQSNQLLNTLRDAGVEVSAVVGIADFSASEPGTSIAPLVTVIEKAIDRFNYGDHNVRFPRTHLVTHIAALELNRPASGEKVDALLTKLREYWTRPGTDDGRPRNVLATVLQAFPNVGGMTAALIVGLGRRSFRLWLWGFPGIGSGCRWLRQQRKDGSRRVDFKTFLLRLTPQGRQERPLNIEALVAQAFLEDLRVAYQAWLWDPRTWNLYRRPVLILDDLDDALPKLFDTARTKARDQDEKPDPLLIVRVPRPVPPEHTVPRREHYLTSRVVPEIGDPGQLVYQRPSKPALALVLSTFAILGILTVVVVVVLRLFGIPATQSPSASSTPRPSNSPAQTPSPPNLLTASNCAVPAGQNGETDLAAWKDDAGETECVGFSGSSQVFTNPDFRTNAQEARMTYDQEQIFGLNGQIDKAAEHPVPGSPGVYEIVYFAGLTESPIDEYDSAEAEEMEGLLAAQRSVYGDDEDPQLKVIIANGGAKMQDANRVAEMIIRRFRGDKHFLGVVGLDRSTGDVQNAIKDFSAAHIPMLATTLSADGIGDGSPYYFSLSPTNTDEARLMLLYIQRAVPRYFGQPASVYPSNGFITAQHIVVYQPKVTDQPNDDDLYISTLVSDLKHQSKNYRGLPPLTFTENPNDPRLCGAATVDIYAGRHDRPLDSASESKNDDFTQFLTRIGHCKNAMPFVIADDGVTRFVADPADRSHLDASELPISYVTKGINILSTGTECLSPTTASTVTAQQLVGFCAQYAKIATVLRDKGIKLLWTGERVGLAYDAAQMFLQAAETYWRTGAAITNQEIPGEFENPNPGYNLVTGSVSFTKTLHTGVDTLQGMPLAIVRILISSPTALPACEFTGFNGDQLSPIPHLDNQQEACVDESG
jgi:hypothetical protein